MKISYIVPVYNGQTFILRCLDSILSQRFQAIEVVFVDDGSLDDSARILREASSKHKQCRAYFQQNRGCAAARNKAIREARGEFLAILDVDDIAIGERSRVQYEAARERNVDLVVGGSKIVDVNRNQLGAYSPPLQPDKLYKALLRRKASFHHSSCLMKTSKVVSLGGYCERFRQGEDLDLFLRFFEAGTVAAVSDFVVEHTRHEGSLSNGSNLEENLFFGVFVTACHLLRSNRVVDVANLEDAHYSNTLKNAREWYANSQSIREFRFKQKIKNSRKKGTLELLRKIFLNPLPSTLCAVSKIRGDHSPVKLARYLLESGKFSERSLD